MCILRIRCQVCLIKFPFLKICHDEPHKVVSDDMYLKDTWSTRCNPWGRPQSAASLVVSGSLLGILLFHVPSRIPCGEEVKVLSSFQLSRVNMEQKVWSSRECSMNSKEEMLTGFKRLLNSKWKHREFGSLPKSTQAVESKSWSDEAGKQKFWADSWGRTVWR